VITRAASSLGALAPGVTAHAVGYEAEAELVASPKLS
jgi:hypothetical protein